MLGDAFPIRRIRDALAERIEVVLVARHLDVGEELAALADEVQASAQQVSGRPHAGRVGVRLRQHPAAEERRNLQRVDAVVLGLAAVDGLHHQRVAENEGDALPGAQVGQPVPGEEALDGKDEVVAGRGHGSGGIFTS